MIHLGWGAGTIALILIAVVWAAGFFYFWWRDRWSGDVIPALLWPFIVVISVLLDAFEF